VESNGAALTRIGFNENLPDGHEDLWDLELWAPTVIEHFITELTIALHIGVIDLGQEFDLQE